MQWSPIHPKKSLQMGVRTIDGPMLRRVNRENLVRAEVCIEARGAHFENLL